MITFSMVIQIGTYKNDLTLKSFLYERFCIAQKEKFHYDY